jgi:hypothetical protein
MRFFNYMRRIYHIASTLSRKNIFNALEADDLPQCGRFGGGQEMENGRREIGSKRVWKK